ncbi:zincin [Karstenula rhodostoma CBS 690.94]|uniref:Zincin n=1 Tax=Karstenula rhodostoma CBS 690.94 TaxID=1392251 RepID=A0A9P4UGB9_9PLEO|nr:zincin [Karstenula rhodostoma CBS 690.94]
MHSFMMFKLLALIALGLMVELVGAASSSVTRTNGTGQGNNLHDRSLNAIYGGDRTTWPLGKIPYCYASIAARAQLKHHIDSAIQIWMTALGGPASAVTAHGLSLTEVVDDQGQPIYCFFNDYQSYEHPGSWHTAIWKHVLAIHLQGGGGARSTLGYFEQGAAGRHALVSGLDAPNIIQITLAHELGHVFGLGHEHQRNDRWMDYMAQAQAANPGPLGFISKDFLIWPAPQGLLTAYDVTSIMHYDSRTAASPDCSSLAPHRCPLLHRNGGYIYKNRVPSAKDVTGIRAMYPWQG